MNFVSELVEEWVDAISKTEEEKKAEEEAEVFSQKQKDLDDFCDNEIYWKLKYESTKSNTKNYLDDYESGVIEDKILMEIVLNLDPFKTESLRSSTQILDFLGDIGGFYGALDLIVFMIGEFFSSKFFIASIAGTLYMQSRSGGGGDNDEEPRDKSRRNRKKGDKNLGKTYTEDDGRGTDRPMLTDKDGQQKSKFSTHMKTVEKKFEEIKFSTFDLLMDPLLGYVFCFCKPCMKSAGFFQRPEVLTKCEDKFTEELEITTLLSKIRDSYDMLRHLQTDEQKQLLKFNQDRVIDLDENDEDSDEGGDSDQSEADLEKKQTRRASQYMISELNPEQNLSMSSSTKEKDDLILDLPDTIKQAFNFSIVKGLALDSGEQKGLLEKLSSSGMTVKPPPYPEDSADEPQEKKQRRRKGDDDLPPTYPSSGRRSSKVSKVRSNVIEQEMNPEAPVDDGASQMRS
mmetsp:Transcript_14830/g.22996  ORF Transcript_14830/g.22996 Transcript_14830/m.22996 type:complete len:457 (-) Transcript_14830:84-1454(-)